MGNKEKEQKVRRSDASPAETHAYQDAEKGVRPSEIRFDETKGTLLLGLDGKEQIGPELAAYVESQEFSVKDEFHLTLIGFKQGVQLKKAFEQNPELANEVAALTESIDWRIYDTGEFYKLTKRYEGEDAPRQSIIEMKSCPATEAFIDRLNYATGLELQVQPPHVTLATRGDAAQGIGLNTDQDLLDFGERIVFEGYPPTDQT